MDRTPEHRTASGLPIEPSYGPESGRDLDRIGSPGEFPYTRGVHRDMYRGRLWTMRQYSGFGSPEATNERYRFLLDQGQTGLSVAFDLPSQIGYDSDDPDGEEEVGRVGVPIDTLADMEIVFDGIPLDRVSTSFTINGTAAIMLAMYLVVAERQGVPQEKVTGTIQNDILKEYVSRGTWIFPPDPSLRLIVDTIEYCAERVPRFNPVSIAGAHFRDAGATAVQELAFTIADGITYVERCVARGMDVELIGSRLSFFFYTHMDFFEEIAKYRAGRRIWARIMKERFGATDPRAMMFRAGVVCGGSSLTAEQPQNNIVRVAYEAMASVLGGVQSIFTAAWDEALTLPSQETAELALRTQQVLALETGVPSVADPLGGSWYVEELTDRFEAAVLTIVDRIDELGGMVACIESGWVQSEIGQRAYEDQHDLESGRRPVVGVNRHAREEPPPTVEFYETPPEEVERQRERLRRVRAERDDGRVRAALDALAATAESTDNMMPALLECVRAYCTVGEMTATMRSVFGDFQQPLVV
ncbi:acyl-CoA mutase large subunit family protein [Blastococcus tunisiensis]|uniref:Methylmalonyl-CoA mutase n=1 Tax=Blastococcus tunisiensis TaxID=1798228 RepID=A0A1I1ZSS8_9ACTN|nr:methylmalonyl-CoA mutase family protein [Blastococcus sp. DSM 46838]SFE33683.1 methylmalonyl-CoA mutase [Blastococcus sp. DSM 46838]